jgi:hypothetical protein
LKRHRIVTDPLALPYQTEAVLLTS